MLRRCWYLAVVGVSSLTCAPAWGQEKYDKEAVQALSKRIDQHLAKGWKKAKVTPAPKADDYTFFRRLNLDLNGRIPESTAIQDFIDDDNKDKRWKWVDWLLGGELPNTAPQYAVSFSDHHARHFAAVWRHNIIGYQTNQQNQFLVPQFEQWLKSKVEKNVALNDMVNQLLTNQNGQVGMGGPGGGQPFQQGSPQLFFQVNENKAENLAGAASRAFLGVKIECAQCHSHPFAKWKQDQFWEFAAFYSSAQDIIRPKGKQPIVPNPKLGREIKIPGTDKVVQAKFLNGKSPDWDANSGNSSRKVVADWITSEDNPYFAKAMADHIWSYLMGVGINEPIMEPSDDIPMTHPELLNDMAKALAENKFDAKFLIRAIVHTEAYQRSSAGAKLADKEDYHLFVRMPMRALSPEQIYDSLVMATGYRETIPMQDPRFGGNPFGPNQSARSQFLLKYTTQDRRHEPQTSILQALFLMNGKFMMERTKLENNLDLQVLAKETTNHKQTITSLYRWVLSRLPRQNELDRLVPYLEKGGATGNLGQAISDVYWALLNSSEFLLNH